MRNGFWENIRQFIFCLDLYHRECLMILRKHPRLGIGATVMTIIVVLSEKQLLWKLTYPGLIYLFLMLAIIDHRRYIIPDILLQCLLLVCIAIDAAVVEWNLPVFAVAVLLRIANGLAIFIPLLLFILLMDRILQKETMGGGDLKLFFVVGFLFGAAQALLVLWMACIIGLLWQIGLYIRKQDKLLPFGPSIAIASWFVLVYGEQLLEKFFYIPL